MILFMKLKNYFSFKQIFLIALLVLGLNFFYLSSTISEYPYDAINLFAGFGSIVIAIYLSLSFS